MEGMTEAKDPCADSEQVGYTDGQRAVWRGADGALFSVYHPAKGTPFRTSVEAQEVTKWLKTPIPWKL